MTCYWISVCLHASGITEPMECYQIFMGKGVQPSLGSQSSWLRTVLQWVSKKVLVFPEDIWVFLENRCISVKVYSSVNLLFYIYSDEVLWFWRPPWSVYGCVLVHEETDLQSKGWKGDFGVRWEYCRSNRLQLRNINLDENHCLCWVEPLAKLRTIGSVQNHWLSWEPLA